MLNIGLEDVDDIFVGLDNHRYEGNLLRLELREFGVAIPRLERGEIFVLLRACPIRIWEVALVILRKGELYNLVLEDEILLEVCDEAICYALIVGAELNGKASREVDAQGVVVILDSVTEVELRRNLAIYACALNLLYCNLLAKCCTLINLQADFRRSQNLLAVALNAVRELWLSGYGYLQLAIW